MILFPPTTSSLAAPSSQPSFQLPITHRAFPASAPGCSSFHALLWLHAPSWAQLSLHLKLLQVWVFPSQGKEQLPSEASPDSSTVIGETCHTHTESTRRSNRCCLSQSLEPNYRRLQKLFINIYTHLNIFINVSGLDKSVYCCFSLRHTQVSFIQCSYNNHIFVLSCFFDEHGQQLLTFELLLIQSRLAPRS